MLFGSVASGPIMFDTICRFRRYLFPRDDDEDDIPRGRVPAVTQEKIAARRER